MNNVNNNNDDDNYFDQTRLVRGVKRARRDCFHLLFLMIGTTRDEVTGDSLNLWRLHMSSLAGTCQELTWPMDPLPSGVPLAGVCAGRLVMI